MSYTDPCKGDCGATSWVDCDKNCSSKKPILLTKEQEIKNQIEFEKREKGKAICQEKGHDWEYTFIIYQCKRCGEISDY